MVDVHAVRASGRPHLSTRKDHAVSEREREGERLACSCHSSVQPSGLATSQNVPARASETTTGLEKWPKAVQGQTVEGRGRERPLTGQMMEYRLAMEAG